MYIHDVNNDVWERLAGGCHNHMAVNGTQVVKVRDAIIY
jgi:hypothetical protein